MFKYLSHPVSVCQTKHFKCILTFLKCIPSVAYVASKSDPFLSTTTLAGLLSSVKGWKVFLIGKLIRFKMSHIPLGPVVFSGLPCLLRVCIRRAAIRKIFFFGILLRMRYDDGEPHVDRNQCSDFSLHCKNDFKQTNDWLNLNGISFRQQFL